MCVIITLITIVYAVVIALCIGVAFLIFGVSAVGLSIGVIVGIGACAILTVFAVEDIKTWL